MPVSSGLYWLSGAAPCFLRPGPSWLLLTVMSSWAVRGEEQQLTLATMAPFMTAPPSPIFRRQLYWGCRGTASHIATDNSNNCSVKSSSKSRYLSLSNYLIMFGPSSLGFKHWGAYCGTCDRRWSFRKRQGSSSGRVRGSGVPADLLVCCYNYRLPLL